MHPDFRTSVLKDLRAFDVDIVSLKSTTYVFEYNVGDAFFAYFDTELVQKGNCAVKVEVTKSSTMLKVNFNIVGTVELTCDRSLEPFIYPIAHEHLMYFKFGDENGDDSDDIVVISRSAQAIHLGKYIYEFIGLEIPFKKLHPRFITGQEEAVEAELIYATPLDSEEENGSSADTLSTETDLEASLAQLQEKFKKKNK